MSASSPPSAPEVSVIMANYNKGKFISAAIQSVLEQTFAGVELVIVDDASTDQSVVAAAEYARAHSDRVRLITFDQHRGPAAARNAGILGSRGDVICFLDSDDVYSPSKVEQQLRALREEQKPVVVYCDWWRMDENGDTLSPGKRERLRKSGHIFSDAMCMVFGFSTMFMVRKEVLKAVGLYDESLIWAEDYDLVLKLARDYDFKYVQEKLYGYRTHPQNTRNMMSRKERLYFEGLVTERHYLSGKGLLDRGARAKVVSIMMRYFAITGQRRKMLKYSFSSPGAFKSMVSSFVSFREIQPAEPLPAESR